MGTTKRRIAVLVSLAAALAVSGCSDPQHEKEDVVAAVEKQSEVKAYAFSGHASIDWGSVELSKEGSQASAILSSLTALFSDSTWTWSGAVSSDPLRMEAEYMISPGGAQQALDFPLIIKDNLLYLSIPYLNKKGEFFSFDMGKWSGANADEAQLPIEGLQNADETVGQIVSLLLTDVEPGWFKEAKEPVSLPSGEKGRSISLAITDKNREELSRQFAAQMPAIGDVLAASGILTTAQAHNLKTSGSNFTLTGPGELTFLVDETGYLRQLALQLDFVTDTKEANPEVRHILYRQSYDAINQTPAFGKEIPKDAKSFEEVMKLLTPDKP